MRAAKAFLAAIQLSCLCSARGEPSRVGAFEPWPRPLNETSIVLVKIHKTAGSTLGGVLRRVADLHGLAGARTGKAWSSREPLVYAFHRSYRELEANIADLQQTPFLLTFVRDPRERALSEYWHFEVTRQGASTSDAAVMAYLDGVRDPQFQYAAAGEEDTVPGLLARYAFVGVTEQYAASVAVLSSMLGARLGEVVALPTKQSRKDAKDDLGHAFVRRPELSELSETLQKYLNTTFLAQNARDYRLWRAASSHLRKAIKSRPDLGVRTTAFEAIQEEALGMCGHLKGKGCLWNDHGCGHECLTTHFAGRNS